MDACGVGHADRELVEVGAAVERGAPASASARSSCARLRRAAGGDVAQPVRPERREIDGRRERAQRLVGADVARGLVAPDVLLSRAQRHDVGAPALDVGRPADEPPGHLADEVRRAARRPRYGPPYCERDAERLALAGSDVGAVLPGRREDRERDRLDDRDEQRAGRVGQRAPPRPSARGCRTRWAGRG